MRMSKRFGKTQREKPAEAEIPSHELLVRAGMIAKLAAGIYSYLPFAWRSIKKIENIMRREMDLADGQELNMPVVHPADIWQESGRWYDVGPEMVRFKDRSGRDMVLAMTHEEPTTDLARRYIDSYKQLPLVVYHIQTKFRDEPRSRGGLVRVREFVMKDAYSFHTTLEDLDAYYPRQCRAYRRICESCGAPVVQVDGDVGMMGGTDAHEFTFLTDVGEDTLLLCPVCGYAANRDVATLDKKAGIFHNGDRDVPALDKVATPGKETIASVCEFLGVDPKLSVKTMVYYAGAEPVILAIRGDLDVNEVKLANLLRCETVRLALPEELETLGLSRGYMSPVGSKGVKVVADDSVIRGVPYVVGANEAGYHYVNAVLGRDFTCDLTADIASAREGDPCPRCGAELSARRGIEIGNTFKLGVKYSKPMKAEYQTEDGRSEPIVMGCYGMGVGRLLACVVEANHDDKGIIWPMPVAPYHVYIVQLGVDPGVAAAAQKIYSELVAAGVETVLDDRNESAGVKFNDADLIGIPIRLTVATRSLAAGGAEMVMRGSPERQVVPLAELVSTVKDRIAAETERYTPKE